MVPVKLKTIRYLMIFALMIGVVASYQNCSKAHFSMGQNENVQNQGTLTFTVSGPTQGSINEALSYSVSDVTFTPANTDAGPQQVTPDHVVWSVASQDDQDVNPVTFTFDQAGVFTIHVLVGISNGMTAEKDIEVTILNDSGTCLSSDHSFELSGAEHVPDGTQPGESAGSRNYTYNIHDLNNANGTLDPHGRCYALVGNTTWSIAAANRGPTSASIVSSNNITADVNFGSLLNQDYILTTQFTVSDANGNHVPVTLTKTIQVRFQAPVACTYDEVADDALKYYELIGIHDATDSTTIYYSKYHFYVQIFRLMNMVPQPTYRVDWSADIHRYTQGIADLVDVNLNQYRNSDQSLDYWLHGGNRYTIYAKVTRDNCSNSKTLSVVLETAHSCNPNVSSCTPPGTGQYAWECQCSPGHGRSAVCVNTSTQAVVNDSNCSGLPPAQCTTDMCPGGSGTM